MPNLIYTRPKDRGSKLQDSIAQLGFNLINIPCIEFEYNFSEIKNIKNFNTYDYFIFTSITAIESTIEFFQQNNINYYFLNDKSITIGKGSYGTLVKNNISDPILPQIGTTSEDLLELDVFKNSKNKKFLIFKGDISRNHINNTLKVNQFKFDEIVVYNIKPSKTLNNDITFIEKLNLNDINILFFTSISIIDNFISFAEKNFDHIILKKIKSFIIIVPSDRLVKYVNSLGFYKIYNTKEMTNKAIIDTLKKIIT